MLGASLTHKELDLLNDVSEGADCETLVRYRASLPEKRAKAEGAALLSWAYRKAERRGVAPWREVDSALSEVADVADVLEARGVDGSVLRFFTE